MITELCKGQFCDRHFSQFTYEDVYTIICVVTAQKFSDSSITSLVHCCSLGKRPTALPKLNYVHGSHTSCESVDTIYPNEQIHLTVSRSGRNNQESKDIQLTAQINCSDVRGVAHIKMSSRDAGGELERTDTLCTLILFQRRLFFREERGKLWKCL